MQAIAYRAGTAWTVSIVDGTEPTLERRSAPLSLVAESLRPKGSARESFAGRTANHLTPQRIAQITSLLQTGMAELGVPGVAFSLMTTDAWCSRADSASASLASPIRSTRTLFIAASNTLGDTAI